MDTDSQNEGRASLEEIATNLGVEEEFVGDEKSCQKSMPNLHRKFTGAVGFETSTLDLGRQEWRLAKRGCAGIYIVFGFDVVEKRDIFINFKNSRKSFSV